MRQICSTIVLVLFISVCTAHSSTAQNAAAVHRVIQANYAFMDAALDHGNLGGALAFYEPGYVLVSNNGGVSPLEARQRAYQKIIARASSLRSDTKINREKISADTATVLTTHHANAVIANTLTGQFSTYQTTDLTKEIWVRHGNLWLVKIGYTLSTRFTVNGRPRGNN